MADLAELKAAVVAAEDQLRAAKADGSDDLAAVKVAVREARYAYRASAEAAGERTGPVAITDEEG